MVRLFSSICVIFACLFSMAAAISTTPTFCTNGQFAGGVISPTAQAPNFAEVGCHVNGSITFDLFTDPILLLVNESSPAISFSFEAGVLDYGAQLTFLLASQDTYMSVVPVFINITNTIFEEGGGVAIFGSLPQNSSIWLVGNTFWGIAPPMSPLSVTHFAAILWGVSLNATSAQPQAAILGPRSLIYIARNFVNATVASNGTVNHYAAMAFGDSATGIALGAHSSVEVIRNNLVVRDLRQVGTNGSETESELVGIFLNLSCVEDQAEQRHVAVRDNFVEAIVSHPIRIWIEANTVPLVTSISSNSIVGLPSIDEGRALHLTSVGAFATASITHNYFEVVLPLNMSMQDLNASHPDWGVSLRFMNASAISFAYNHFFGAGAVVASGSLWQDSQLVLTGNKFEGHDGAVQPESVFTVNVRCVTTDFSTAVTPTDNQTTFGQMSGCSIHILGNNYSAAMVESPNTNNSDILPMPGYFISSESTATTSSNNDDDGIGLPMFTICNNTFGGRSIDSLDELLNITQGINATNIADFQMCEYFAPTSTENFPNMTTTTTTDTATTTILPSGGNDTLPTDAGNSSTTASPSDYNGTTTDANETTTGITTLTATTTDGNATAIPTTTPLWSNSTTLPSNETLPNVTDISNDTSSSIGNESTTASENQTTTTEITTTDTHDTSTSEGNQSTTVTDIPTTSSTTAAGNTTASTSSTTSTSTSTTIATTTTPAIAAAFVVVSADGNTTLVLQQLQAYYNLSSNEVFFLRVATVDDRISLADKGYNSSSYDPSTAFVVAFGSTSDATQAANSLQLLIDSRSSILADTLQISGAAATAVEITQAPTRGGGGSDGDNKTGLIVGVVIGGVAFLAIIVGIACYCRSAKRSKQVHYNNYDDGPGVIPLRDLSHNQV